MESGSDYTLAFGGASSAVSRGVGIVKSYTQRYWFVALGLCIALLFIVIILAATHGEGINTTTTARYVITEHATDGDASGSVYQRTDSSFAKDAQETPGMAIGMPAAQVLADATYHCDAAGVQPGDAWASFLPTGKGSEGFTQARASPYRTDAQLTKILVGAQ